QTGVVRAEEADFLPATLCWGETTVSVQLRLREGLAEHLGPDDKWAYEVRTQNQAEVLGLQRFYLQDPEGRTGLNTWAFVQALQREGVLAAQYQFVRLTFNGKYLGIYAMQEGFTQALLMTQGRTPGVIAEFRADRLWDSIANFEGDVQAATADPVANLSATDFQYFEINTFQDAIIARDPVLSAQQKRAMSLLYDLQTGALPASEIFDMAQYGRFLALADLWGATNVTSPVNLKYYYNPETNRLEIIVSDATVLSGEARLSIAATYNDSQLQAAYVKEAARISQTGYIDTLQAALKPEWLRLTRALGGEFGDLAAPWDTLCKRQSLLQHSLNPVQPVFAYLVESTPGTYDELHFEVGNVLNLPVEIMGFDIAGATFQPVNRAWLPETPTELLVDVPDAIVLRAFGVGGTRSLCYMRIDVPLTAIHAVDREIDFNRPLNIRIAVRLLGSERVLLAPVQYGLPAGASK
ncbi:MAG: hypothetical protein K8R89_05105, partial [Anaerolineae bacterium]|nr:hypothetical protein [Anaerolineae bacterium]